jgi:hypothetical protein
MARHVKKEYKVGLDRDDTAACKELVRRERDIRKDNELGVGTILKEHAMPSIRTRLAELRAQESLEPAGAQS